METQLGLFGIEQLELWPLVRLGVGVDLFAATARVASHFCPRVADRPLNRRQEDHLFPGPETL